MSVVERGLPHTDNGSQREPVRSRRRRVRARLSREHWLALVGGAVAFVLVFAALRDRRETVEVLVAGEAIPPATRVTSGMVRWVELPADSPIAASLVERGEFVEGASVTTRPVVEGEPLTAQALADDVREDGLRSMSVPVPPEHAVGGELEPGDRVDVLGVLDGGQVDYVVTGVEVLAVSEERSGSLGAEPGEFAVVVAVDAGGARRLARALTGDTLEVVRSTGAPPVVESSPSVRVGG